MDEDSYLTPARGAEGEFVERRSRFIGAIRPVKDEREALAFLEERRKRFWDASHNVYAYVLREGQSRRYSDDGEPQGTAGIPVLEVLLREGLTDCAVVITRYFGGVLLGAGGLTRAYARGAKTAVDAGGAVLMRRCTRAVIVCDYAQYGRASSLVSEEEGRVIDTRYTDRVEIEFLLPRERLEPAGARLTDLSAGSLLIEPMGEEYAPFPVEK